jgi:hypothetical protein
MFEPLLQSSSCLHKREDSVDHGIRRSNTSLTSGDAGSDVAGEVGSDVDSGVRCNSTGWTWTQAQYNRSVYVWIHLLFFLSLRNHNLPNNQTRKI